MNIAVLGTGIVGRTHAAKLASLGHDVTIGTKDVKKTLAETEPDAMGNPPFSIWQKENKKVKLVPFAAAAKHGEIIFEALHGMIAVEVLRTLEIDLDQKILINISNPLDFSKGMPPTLTVSNTDSLGEQIQKALPNTKVVKTLNTVGALLQVNPGSLADGDHHIFVSGNDTKAKTKVIEILKEWYGWKHIIDLGYITTARGTEMTLPMWLRLWGALGTGNFNYKIVTSD